MRYVALLRGINVGGNKKVPMKDLAEFMKVWGFSGVKTLLNSGNVIFETNEHDGKALETFLEEHLKVAFGFPVPCIIRSLDDIQILIKSDPFMDVVVHDQIRLYVTFFKNDFTKPFESPWSAPDNSYHILSHDAHHMISYLDLSVTNTIKGMDESGKIFGKEVTTRNWNTVEKIGVM
jgi:uncharacterized protein (DUF1697 family)